MVFLIQIGEKFQLFVKHFQDGHLVLRQRARLIRTDDGSGTERLDGGEFLDNGVFLDHFLNADRQNDGDDGRQPLRDRRHRQCDGELEALQKIRFQEEIIQRKHDDAD